MSEITRRDLLRTGLALSTGTLVARGSDALGAPRLAGDSPDPGAHTNVAQSASVSPRERLLFDFGWRFHLGCDSAAWRDLGTEDGQDVFSKTGTFIFATEEFDDSRWRSLNLPHDWAVELPFVRDEALQSHGYKPLGRNYPETSVGWYRRGFRHSRQRLRPAHRARIRRRLSQRTRIRQRLLHRAKRQRLRSRSASTSATSCITAARNILVVRVDATFGDGWFYEGAGIYRHVWLTKTDGSIWARGIRYVRTDVKPDASVLSLTTGRENEDSTDARSTVHWKILDADGRTVATARTAAAALRTRGKGHVHCPCHVALTPPLVAGDSVSVFRGRTGRERRSSARRRARCLWRPHGRIRPRQGLLPERPVRENQGHLQSPGSRRRRRGRCPIGCRGTGSRYCARWAATRCARRTTCRHRNGWRPASAWA